MIDGGKNIHALPRETFVLVGKWQVGQWQVEKVTAMCQWLIRFIGCKYCRPHEGGSSGNLTLSRDSRWHGTYILQSPYGGSSRESPTLTSQLKLTTATYLNV